MRGNWEGNTALQQYLHGSPPKGGVIVQVEAVESQDLKDTKSDWQGMDDTGGFAFPDEGGIRLSGDSETYVDHGGDSGTDATDQRLTDLNPEAPFVVCEIHWTGNQVGYMEIATIRARLDARNTGDPQEIAKWRCQLFRVHKLTNVLTDPVEIQPISQIVEAVPGGGSPEDVSFDFTGATGQPVRPGAAPTGASSNPITVVKIWGSKANGEAAGNGCWFGDPASPPAASGGDVSAQLYGYLYETVELGQKQTGTSFMRSTVADGVPRIEVLGRSYEATTAEFSDLPIDLGATPTAPVQFVTQDSSPGDSSVVYQVRNDANSAWVTFKDGDLAASLAGVTDRQQYRVRVTLTPSTDGRTSPYVQTVGAKSVEVLDCDATAEYASPPSVDTVDHHAQIPEVTIRFRRGGVVDYRDVSTELFAGHHIGSLEFHLYAGHVDLPRADWLKIETVVADELHEEGPDIVAVCVSPLMKTAATIPQWVPGEEEGTGGREPIRWENKPLKEAWAEILDAHLALPARYRGQAPEATTPLDRVIKEERGQSTLDQLAFIADGAAITSQGRVKFVSLGKAGGPVASFPMEEIHADSVTPGFRGRIEEFFVPYGWDENTGEFQDEIRGAHAAAIERLGQTFIDPPARLSDEIAKWIPKGDDATAVAIAARVLKRLGTGQILWDFKTKHANPHLELGDVVAVETDRFVVANPNTDPPVGIRGRVWATGVVQRIGDLLGTDLTIWIQSYDDIVASTTVIERTGYIPGNLLSVSISLDANASGVANGTVQVSRAIKSFQVLAVNGAAPSSEEVLERGRIIDVEEPTTVVPGLASGQVGDTINAAVIGFSRTGGAGDESDMARASATIQAKPNNTAPSGVVTGFISGNFWVRVTLKSDPDKTMQVGEASPDAFVRFIRRDTGAAVDVSAPVFAGVREPYWQTSYPVPAEGDEFDVDAYFIWRVSDGELSEPLLVPGSPVRVADDNLARISPPEITWELGGKVGLRGIKDDDCTYFKWVGRYDAPWPNDAATLAAIVASTDVADDIDVNYIFAETEDDIPPKGGTYYVAIAGFDASDNPGPVQVGQRTRLQNDVETPEVVSGIQTPRFSPYVRLNVSPTYRAFSIKLSRTAPFVETDYAIDGVTGLIEDAMILRDVPLATRGDFAPSDFEVIDNVTGAIWNIHEYAEIHGVGENPANMPIPVDIGGRVIEQGIVYRQRDPRNAGNPASPVKFTSLFIYLADLFLTGAEDVQHLGIWCHEDGSAADAPGRFFPITIEGPNYLGENIQDAERWANAKAFSIDSSEPDLRLDVPGVSMYSWAGLEALGLKRGMWVEPRSVIELAEIGANGQGTLRLELVWGPTMIEPLTPGLGGPDFTWDASSRAPGKYVIRGKLQQIPADATWAYARLVGTQDFENDFRIRHLDFRFLLRQVPAQPPPPSAPSSAYLRSLQTGAAQGSYEQGQQSSDQGASRTSTGEAVNSGALVSPNASTTLVSAEGSPLMLDARTSIQAATDLSVAIQLANQAIDATGGPGGAGGPNLSDYFASLAGALYQTCGWAIYVNPTASGTLDALSIPLRSSAAFTGSIKLAKHAPHATQHKPGARLLLSSGLTYAANSTDGWTGLGFSFTSGVPFWLVCALDGTPADLTDGAPILIHSAPDLQLTTSWLFRKLATGWLDDPFDAELSGTDEDGGSTITTIYQRAALTGTIV